MNRPSLFYVAIGVLVVSNAFVLVHAARNRAGEPEAELELTERELSYYLRGDDDSNITFRLQYQNPVSPYYYPGARDHNAEFYDRSKLAETGFDVSVAANDPRAERFYSDQPPHIVFVALEYDGPAWLEWQKRMQEEIPTEYQSTTSHLVWVDVGLDPIRLREKFPDRKKVMILPAEARAMFYNGTPQVVRGAITTLSTANINVPHAFRSELPTQYAPGGRQPFTATLRVGRLYEPWITSVRAPR